MKIPIDIKTGNISSPVKEENIIVGIDLGTTNSLIAYIDNGTPKAICESTGKHSLVPSVIYFAPNDEVIVGHDALPFMTSDPENTIFSVKRLLGKNYADIESESMHLGYKIINEETSPLVKIRVRNKFYNPVELSAEILKVLKKRAESALQKEIQKVVITVPAYFNDAQRQATRDAGKLAGLDVLRIINEPTAASLAYGLGQNSSESRTIAVYDLGGGTFDMTILKLENGIFDVLSTHGDTHLGGDDIDKAIVQFWLKNEPIKNSVDSTTHGMQHLRILAERAKKTLSAEDSFEESFNNIPIKLGRSEFEAIIEPVFRQTMISCKQALADAGLTADQIDRIILAGGSTRIPFIREQLGQFFGKTPDTSSNPDEIVALGAAIQADILSGKRKDMLLLDVTPLSLGIETVGGLMDVIIPRNAKVPQSVAREYTTSVDGQKNLKIAVYQGERDLVEFNRKLGEFILKNIPPMPAGLPKIQIHFILDADGILTVKAIEKRSGTETSVEIKSAYGIPEEEMARMLLDSIKNAEQDKKAKFLQEAKNEANNILLSTEKFIIQNQSWLSDDQKSELIRLSEVLKTASDSDHKDAIEAAMDNLNIYANPLAHEALEKNIAGALAGQKLD